MAGLEVRNGEDIGVASRGAQGVRERDKAVEFIGRRDFLI